MQIAGFEFSEGARFQSGANTNAKEVGEYLELLRLECKGELTPADVVKAARNENSPLHSFFEWDDSAAAEAHRLNQARGLIRAVVAIYTDPDKPAQRIKAYVHVNETGAPHYREVTHALSQKKTRELVLQRAWRELRQWKERYKHLRQFADLVKVIDETQKKLPAKVASG